MIILNIIRKLKNENLAGYYFVIPALIFMIAFVGYPIIYNIILSFQNASAITINTGVREFVGLDNYKQILANPVFAVSIKNTFFYTIMSMLFQFIIGFAFALYFNLKFKLAEPIRGFLMISWLIPVSISGQLFKYMFSTSNGIINHILLTVHLINSPIQWLENPTTAMWALIIANTWIGVPFNMILLTTGLTTIPNNVYESAAIDGANTIQKFFYITLPLLKPAITAILIQGFIFTFKVFDLVYIVTGGGPVNSTEVLSTIAYRYSFSEFNFGKGAAVANVLFIIMFCVAIWYLRLIKDEEVA